MAPGIAGYRLRAAQLMFQTGDVDNAVRTVRGVARKYSNYAEAHASLAAMLWSQGRFGEAEGEFEAARELEPLWGRMQFIVANTRWPPALMEQFQRFLQIDSSRSP